MVVRLPSKRSMGNIFLKLLQSPRRTGARHMRVWYLLGDYPEVLLSVPSPSIERADGSSSTAALKSWKS